MAFAEEKGEIEFVPIVSYKDDVWWVLLEAHGREFPVFGALILAIDGNKKQAFDESYHTFKCCDKWWA